ncbi:hypothetical protein PHISCL_01976 [Aspergillus sclerotialis]|uniref:Uncharacterized protein n=1 Tax=Aspergillus sclerotialis TaxID=2070753 RepID=A0A3A2ZTR6_9EURO|nr:hypothetical protein PHISCL_01976 [Aspergillus sclerotialis]
MTQVELPIRTRSQNVSAPGSSIPARAATLPPGTLAMRPGNVRFYSRRDTSSNDDTSSMTSSTSTESTDTASSLETDPTTAPSTTTSPSQSAQGQGQEQASSPTLEETRSNALNTLAMCRTVIVTLEITRMYKSRLGFSWWLAFWEKIYDRTLAHALGARVTTALNKINLLFRSVSSDLKRMTAKMEKAVRRAKSSPEILKYLEYMENEVGVRRRNRRDKASSILNRMRAGIENIPVKVTDELFDDMKRGIFALDVFCDYHPGDPEAEARDRLGPRRLEENREEARESAFGYTTWEEDEVGGERSLGDGFEGIDTLSGGWVSETSSEGFTVVPSGSRSTSTGTPATTVWGERSDDGSAMSACWSSRESCASECW